MNATDRPRPDRNPPAPATRMPKDSSGFWRRPLGVVPFLALAGGGLLGLWFWSQLHRIDADQHRRYVDTLRRAQTAGIELDRALLNPVSAETDNRAPIAIDLAPLQTNLEQIPAFVEGADREALYRQVQTYIEGLRQKQTQVQQWQTQNGELRAALNQFQTDTTALIQKQTTSLALQYRLSRLLQTVLLAQTENSAVDVQQEAVSLRAIAQRTRTPELSRLMAQAQSLVNQRPQVAARRQALLSQPIAERSTDLIQTYDRLYDEARDRVDRNRLWAYLLSLLLLAGGAAATIFYLRSRSRALHESESKLRNLFQNSQIGIFRVRLEDGLILDANPRLVTMLGYDTAEEVIGKKHTTDLYLDPGDRPRALQKLQMTGEINDFETCLRRKDGSTFWGLYSARYDAETHSVDGVIADISALKQAENARQTSETELRGLFTAMTDVILVYNREGRCLKLVSTNSDLLVQPIAAQVNRTVYEVLPEKQAQFHHRHIQEALESRRILNNVEYSMTLGEQRYWFSASVSPLSDETVLWVARDITARKRAEEALRQSEATNRALINAIPDLLFRIRQDGTYLDVMNSNYFGILNSSQLSVGTTVYDSLPPDLAEMRMSQVRQALEAWEMQIYEQRLEIDGEARDEEVRVVPIRDDEVLVMVRDITDRKRAEEMLRRSVAAAEAANRAKSVFLANMSHELRTPLNVILGFTQLLIRGGSLNGQQKDYLDTISRSGEHLLTLINDVLEMSKIEAGRVTLNPTDFDLHGLLNWLLQMFQMKAHSKGLHLSLEWEDDLPQYIHTDESKLRQVLVNLVGNAVKFTQQGGVALRVGRMEPEELTGDLANPGTTTVAFEVEDTGPGIEPDGLERLFQPFVQTDSGQKSQEGTGLGLAISQKFVNLMGGTITAQSVPGHGATFRFTIQVTIAQGAASSEAPVVRTIVGLAAGQPTYRILIVEDKPENRQILVDLLSPLGFEVREAINGEEAIVRWEEWAPHLIWMDIRMPVMDGYEATRQIRAREQQRRELLEREIAASPLPIAIPPATKIIALTGSVFEEDRKTALAAGCDDFVRKPFRAERLFEKMGTYLGVRYVYANEPEAVPEAAATNGKVHSPDAVSAADLSVMSIEWRQQLRQAASRVNSKQVLTLVEQIPEMHASLATAITDLVNNFNFEEIVALTED